MKETLAQHSKPHKYVRCDGVLFTKTHLLRKGVRAAVTLYVRDPKGEGLQTTKSLLSWGAADRDGLMSFLASQQRQFISLPSDITSQISDSIAAHEQQGQQRRNNGKQLSRHTHVNACGLQNLQRSGRFLEPQIPFHRQLRYGKGPLTPLQGYAVLPLDKISEMTEKVNRLRSVLIENPSLKLCKCADVDLNLYNQTETAMTVTVQICCSCKQRYGEFTLGRLITTPDGVFRETALRMSLLTQDIKENFNLIEKMQIFFDVKSMSHHTFDRARRFTDSQMKKAGEKSIQNELQNVVEEAKNGNEIDMSADGSWPQQHSERGLASVAVKKREIDSRTVRNSKIIGLSVKDKKVNHMDEKGKPLSSDSQREPTTRSARQQRQQRQRR